MRQEVEEWVASGNKRPHLSVVLVGENPASQSYVLNKTRAAASVGMCHSQSPATVKLRFNLEANSIVTYDSFFSLENPNRGG